ncbi:hypothetical protein AB0L26_25865 [Streptomyces nondiastaticus]|uniref:hypothetical protein n=1 Tax=Streptomyces nondiastaticus TaxID=3154512 RepID=UPI00342F0993
MAGGIVVVGSPSTDNSCSNQASASRGAGHTSPATAGGNVLGIPASAPLNQCGGADLPLKRRAVQEDDGFGLPVPIPENCKQIADVAKPWCLNAVYRSVHKAPAPVGAVYGNVKHVVPKVMAYVERLIEKIQLLRPVKLAPTADQISALVSAAVAGTTEES